MVPWHHCQSDRLSVTKRCSLIKGWALSDSLAPSFTVHAITCRRKRPLVDAMPPQCLSWDLGKVTRFGFCLGCILMMNMARLHVTVLSVQKGAPPSCCSLHDARGDKDVLWPNTQTKTFRLLQVYKYSLIWQDWFSTLYFAKSIVRPKQVKLIFRSLSSPPKASLLTPGDRRFSNFLCPFEKLVYFFLSFFFWVQWNQKFPWACIEVLVWYFRCANFIGSKIQLYCIVVGSWRISPAKLSHGWRLGIIPPSFSFSSHFVRVT